MIGLTAGVLVLALAAFFARRAARKKRWAGARRAPTALPRTAYTRARPWPADGVPPARDAGYRRPLEIRPRDGAPVPERPLRDRYDE